MPINYKQSSTQMSDRLWIVSLFGLLLLASQLFVLQHATEHPFHNHNNYCLSFHAAEASPVLVFSKPVIQLLENQLELIKTQYFQSIHTPFRKLFLVRAPPSIII